MENGGKPYRKMGIGRMLVNYAFEEAKRRGYASVILLTHSTLTAAINLYRKSGFTEISSLPDLPDPTGRGSITMQYIINH
jgi:ribosomal protein S18 acetylase RimI-like enzyme